MTKKKRALPDIDEILQRPWCYYCERDFDDLKILISHQKAKHFKCEKCNRRLNTAGGLSVHLNQVHKENLTSVENALPNRTDVNIEIFGMEGIPEEIMGAHQQRITEAYFRKEAEHRTLTGNPGPGGVGAKQGGEVKKARIETPEEIKQRLAEHKARKAAGLPLPSATTGSGGTTPQTPAAAAPAAAEVANGDQQQQQQQQQQAGYGVVPPSSSSPPAGFNAYQAPPPQPGNFPPPQGFAGSPVNAPSFQAPPQAFSPHHPLPYQQYQPPPNAFSPHPAGFPQGPPPSQSFPHMPPQQQNWSPPPQQSFPPPTMSQGLPSPAPGLPQRPAFNPPNLSKEDMAKMHSGAGLPPGMPNLPKPPNQQQPQNGYRPPSQQSQGFQQQPPSAGNGSLGDSIDELISSVTGEAPPAKKTKIEEFAQIYPDAGMTQEAIDRIIAQQHHQPTPLLTNYVDSGLELFHRDTGGVHRSLTGAQLTKEINSYYGSSVVTATTQPQVKQEPEVKQEEQEVKIRQEPVEDDALPSTLADAATDGKGGKKKKDKKKGGEKTKLMYSDNATSPEEKRAKSSKYAFDRAAHEHTEFVRGEPGEADTQAKVTGAMEETVRDPQD